MSNGTDTPTTPAPGAHIPSDEKPDIAPLVPSKFPLSSAPLPPGVTKENIKKQTPAVSSPDVAPASPPAPGATPTS